MAPKKKSMKRKEFSNFSSLHVFFVFFSSAAQEKFIFVLQNESERERHTGETVCSSKMDLHVAALVVVVAPARTFKTRLTRGKI
jgi:hypothetical protein